MTVLITMYFETQCACKWRTRCSEFFLPKLFICTTTSETRWNHLNTWGLISKRKCSTNDVGDDYRLKLGKMVAPPWLEQGTCRFWNSNRAFTGSYFIYLVIT